MSTTRQGNKNRDQGVRRHRRSPFLWSYARSLLALGRLLGIFLLDLLLVVLRTFVAHCTLLSQALKNLVLILATPVGGIIAYRRKRCRGRGGEIQPAARDTAAE